MESMPLGRTMSKTTSEGPPSSKWQEIPPWNKALKPSHLEASSWDSDLVKEARKEFFSKHSYNFIMEGTHNLSEVFRQMATSTELLGTSIYKIQVSWTGPDEQRQANYALRSLPKGLKFLHMVPPFWVSKGYEAGGNTQPRCSLPLQWHNPLPLVWEGGPEWGDSG